jgi:hypothetical protein
MERLTFDGNFCDIARCMDSRCKVEGTCTQKEVWKRLKAYEDTGWTPEMLHKLGENAWHLWDFAQAAENMTVGRLKELAEADKDGRVVVLPCKVGDTVYRVFTVDGREPVIQATQVKTFGQAADLIGRIGKLSKLVSVFRTREEAERAMQEMEGAT